MPPHARRIARHTSLLRPKVLRRAWFTLTRMFAADRGAVLLVCGFAYVALLLAGVWVSGGEAVPRAWIGLAALLPAAALSAFLSLRTARSRHLGRDPRRAWLLLAAAQLCLAAATAAGGYKLIFGDDPRSLAAGILYLAFYPLFVWGLLCFPGEYGSARRKRVYWLDTVTALLAGAIVFWYVVPALVHAPHPPAGRIL